VYHGDIDRDAGVPYPEAMRRILLLSIVGSIGLTCALGGAWPADAAPLLDYGPDVTTTGEAYSCGDAATFPASQAFDNTSSGWRSSQSGEAVSQFACVGQHFSDVYDIRQITIQQSSSSDFQIASVYWQYADDGAIWHTIAILTLAKNSTVQTFSDLPISGSHLWWRVLANDSAVFNWAGIEMQMMEAIGNPTATPVSTATPPSTTPTITLTPSTTPSPTPNYFVELTATSGAPMRFERSATAGDLVMWVTQLLFGGLAFIAFAIWFWQRRPDGS